MEDLIQQEDFGVFFHEQTGKVAGLFLSITHTHT